MKELIILLTFSLLIFALSAQAGVFGLAYDSSHTDAIATLQTNGFSEYDIQENIVSLYDSTNGYVDHITLRFNNISDTLDEWFVAYKILADEDIEEIALNAVKSYEEEWDDYDEAEKIYSWNLTDTRYILAGYDDAGEFFWVEYRSTDYDAEREAASYEDDYYYYDDDEDWDY